MELLLQEIRDFHYCIENAALFPISSGGNLFSWQKGIGEGKTSSRIDWCLVNVDWMHNLTDVVPEYLNHSISDHTPLLISCLPEASGGNTVPIFQLSCYS